MPANLSPEYKKAEQAFRRAREPRERLDCLKEMLRTIPKHQGTERIQADIKSRIKQFSDELVEPRKGPAQVGSAHSVHCEGAAQVALIGPPNSGKSSLHALLTGSRAEIGPFPYTTRAPLPGMLPFEDIAFQLVDLPPMSSARTEPWMPGVLPAVDAAWLVVDLADPACAEHLLEYPRNRTTFHWVAPSDWRETVAFTLPPHVREPRPRVRVLLEVLHVRVCTQAQRVCSGRPTQRRVSRLGAIWARD